MINPKVGNELRASLQRLAVRGAEESAAVSAARAAAWRIEEVTASAALFRTMDWRVASHLRRIPRLVEVLFLFK